MENNTKALGQLLCGKGVRIAHIINIPLMIMVEDTLASSVEEMLEDNIKQVFTALNLICEDELMEADESAGFILQSVLHDLPADQKIPEYIAFCEMQIPFRLTKVDGEPDTYNYNSYGWGHCQLQFVTGDTMEELVNNLVAERNAMFERIYTDEQNVDEGGYDDAL